MTHPTEVLDLLGLAGSTLAKEEAQLLSELIQKVSHSGGSLAAGAVLSLQMTTAGTYRPAPLRVGPEALVDVRTMRPDGAELAPQRLPVAESWRLADAGLRVSAMSIADAGVWGVALAMTEHQHSVWTVLVTDGSGAGAAVTRSDAFGALLPRNGSPETQRARSSARRVSADRTRREESHLRQDKGLVAGAITAYLGDWAMAEDAGLPPSSWGIWRDAVVVSSGGTKPGTGVLGRLARLRGRSAAELSRDVAGRTRTGRPGTANVPLTDNPEVLARATVRGKDYLQWSDPTGDRATALASGAATLAEAADLWPTSEAERRTFETWLAVGLTFRQAQVLLFQQAGFTQDEIALRLGIARSTVAGTLAAARKTISGEP